jgi:hypothetical protein
MPVFTPGKKRVPRCRTMMLPALHAWLSNSLQPRCFGCDSRPFCVDPPCFLLALTLRTAVRWSKGQTHMSTRSDTSPAKAPVPSTGSPLSTFATGANHNEVAKTQKSKHNVGLHHRTWDSANEEDGNSLPRVQS